MSKTQEELERPAKVYQVLAVETKVDQALLKLDEIVKSVNGVTTVAQVEAMIEKAKADIKEDIDNEIKKIHLHYGPTKGAAIWVLCVVVAALIGQVVYSIFRGN